MKKILLFVLMFLSSVMVVDASSISNIDIDVFVDMYGNATITETWDAYVDQGTEGWHPYYNLSNSVISNLEVTMDGNQFTTVSNWNVDNSLSEKAYKAGIYYVDSNEVDICFGISSYGSHKYVIKYKISNFVSTLEDADMIYWNLFPSNFSVEPGNVDITIYSDFKYSDTLDVWGYGKYGAPCYVYDGKIEMTSDGSRISSSEYMTILVNFPKGTFQTSNVLDNDFDYYYDMAENGAINYNDNSSEGFFVVFWKNVVFSFIIVMVIFNIFLPYIFTFLFNKVITFFDKLFATDSFNSCKVVFEEDRNLKKDVDFFRKIPCNGDVFRAYWLAGTYKLMNKKENFLGVILLKWLNEGKIKLEKSEKKTIFGKKDIVNIVFIPGVVAIKVVPERNLYNYMYQASHDGVLESKEFEKWCKVHYSLILKWFNEVIEYEVNSLVEEGIIRKEIRKKSFSISLYEVYVVNSSIIPEVEQLAGLKKFLEEFTLIKEKEPMDVKLWNEYLIFAQMFGIANKVSKKFEELYPDEITDMNNNLCDFYDINYINSIIHNGVRSASNSKEYVEHKERVKSIANSRAKEYSSTGSGGGGFSSGGGGKSSFGGSSRGGGGFR